MHRYNIGSQILLIFTVIAFALAAPVLVQDKRQACIDVVHVPKGVTTVLRKPVSDQEMWLEYGAAFYDNVWGHLNPAGIHLVPAPPEVHVLPPNPAEVHVPEAHAPPQNPADFDRESMGLDDDAPPASPESGHSYSPLESPKWSTESEDWYTAPSSLGSSTESDSESESDRWSTISNAPSAESQSENLKAADTEMRGKAKVLRRISGTASASGVDT